MEILARALQVAKSSVAGLEESKDDRRGKEASRFDWRKGREIAMGLDRSGTGWQAVRAGHLPLARGGPRHRGAETARPSARSLLVGIRRPSSCCSFFGLIPSWPRTTSFPKEPNTSTICSIKTVAASQATPLLTSGRSAPPTKPAASREPHKGTHDRSPRRRHPPPFEIQLPTQAPGTPAPAACRDKTPPPVKTQHGCCSSAARFWQGITLMLAWLAHGKALGRPRSPWAQIHTSPERNEAVLAGVVGAQAHHGVARQRCPAPAGRGGVLRPTTSSPERFVGRTGGP